MTTQVPFKAPLILMAAPNGAYKQTTDHPALPVTAEALARTAKQCLDAGAAMLHLHIRDSQGRHSLDVDGYRQAIAAVRSAVGQEMVLQVTSEAAKVYQSPAQIAMVRELRPEAVSVGLRELDQPEIGEAGLSDFFSWLADRRIMTQVILYDVKDVQRWQALRASGTIPDNAWSLLMCLGATASVRSRTRAIWCHFLPTTKDQSLGRCVPSVRQNMPASLPLPPWGAMCGSVLKTTFTCITGTRRPTMQRWLRKPLARQ